jgi:hypothetical protein
VSKALKFATKHIDHWMDNDGRCTSSPKSIAFESLSPKRSSTRSSDQAVEVVIGWLQSRAEGSWPTFLRDDRRQALV